MTTITPPSILKPRTLPRHGTTTAQTLVVFIALLCAAYLTGLFAAWSAAVMPGLATTNDQTFVAAIQGLETRFDGGDSVIPGIDGNWPTFIAFFTGPLWCLAALVLYRGQPRVTRLIATALGLLIVGIVTSVLFNVPSPNAQFTSCRNQRRAVMKVLILGATGHLGRYVTQGALDAGHAVTAFARNPASLDIDHPDLALHAGDAQNSQDVADAVAGHDAVIITLGSGKSRKNSIRSDGTRNVIAAMTQHGVDRLITQTTLGCQDTWDTLNFYWKYVMFGAIIKPIFKDHEEQERLTQACGLDWTIVRPSAFTDEPGKGELRMGFPATERGLELTVAKTEIAAVIVDQLVDRAYVHRELNLSR